MIGLLCIGVIAILVTMANACPSGFTYIAGSCYYTNGIDCEVDLSHLENIEQQLKTLVCHIFSDQSVAGLLFCGNPSTNQLPGIVPVIVTTDFQNSSVINNAQNTAHASIITILPQDVLDSLAMQFCQNPGWVGLDFVPCKFTAELTLINNNNVLEQVIHSCSLQNCESLKWNKKLDMTERCQDDCTGPQ
jgi:hypothetical protein